MNERVTLSFVRAVLAVQGLFYLLTGLLMLFAPVWFFDYIGTYDPYNRHFIGDLGAFTLPLGAALLIAARRPARHLSLIAYALAASILHTLNHIYDDVILGDDVTQALVNAGSLAALALLLGIVWWLVWSRRADPHQQRTP
jgi:uncharacterized membrane protein